MSNGERKDKILHRVEEELNQEIHPLLQKIQENIKLIGIVLGSIVLVAAGVTGYRYYKRSSLNQARSTMSQIIAGNEGRALIDSLERFMPDAPAEIKQALRLELAKQSMAQELYDKAATYWHQAAENAAEQNIRIIAGLGRAKALRFMGKPQESLELLEGLSAEAPQEFKRPVHYEIAVAAEASGEWQRALTAYEELQAEADLTSTRGNFIEYKIGRIKERIAAGQS